MLLRMSEKSRREYLEIKRKRYRLLRGKKAKGQILSEVEEMTGYSRKQIIRLMRETREAKSKKRDKRGRPEKLKASDIEVIKEIWLKSEQPCGKRLKAVLEDWLPYYEEEKGKMEPIQRQRILSASSATLDRVLRPCKVSLRGRKRYAKGMSGIQAEVPVREGPWRVKGCGWIEADTVAHCGESMKGSFVWSLTMTDIYSQWTELGAVWNKGQEEMLRAIQRIEKRIPFRIKGIDTDNGSEFMNYHLQNYWKTDPKNPKITRSRPYHKNDNAHVEQKNRTHVREFIGYERFGSRQYVEVLEEIYGLWSDLSNHFIAVMKLKEKKRQNGKRKRKHDQPQSPYQRVMNSPIPKGAKEKLKALHQSLNPYKLKKSLEEKLKELYQMIQVEREEIMREFQVH